MCHKRRKRMMWYLKAGDVLVNEINRVPSISFLTSVHQIMKESMARVAIIKFLERKIEFDSFYSKLQALWKP
ncbi:hypothetical protein Goklo_012350 [Gossypium klotzschianum]|uniref:Uncharacterized protein n=1 Tax=Gossypium klotzschianum TaxID=34286 RepID=A0A7J8VD10_9ROSI|nr:hypothetical protein [Gossypium klotzschianum]